MEAVSSNAAAKAQAEAEAAAELASKVDKVVSVSTSGPEEEEVHGGEGGEEGASVAGGQVSGEPSTAAAAVEQQTPFLSQSQNQHIAEEVNRKLQELTEESLGIEINPNCFLPLSAVSSGLAGAGADPVPYRSDVDVAVAEKDEQVARDLALFLWNEVIPNLVNEV